MLQQHILIHNSLKLNLLRFYLKKTKQEFRNVFTGNIRRVCRHDEEKNTYFVKIIYLSIFIFVFSSFRERVLLSRTHI